MTKFPEKHYFKNTPENRKAFLELFPNEVWCDYTPATKENLEEYEGKYIGKWPEGGLVFSGNLEGSIRTYTEYTFAPPVPQFPTGHFFLNTPENLAAFEKEFPGHRWRWGSDRTAMDVMKHCKETFFSMHDFGGGGWGFCATNTHGLTRYYFPHETRDEPSLVQLANASDTVSPPEGTAGARNLEPGQYITVAQGRLADARKEFANVDEYCTKYTLPSRANLDDAIGIYCEQGTILWNHSDPWFARDMHGAREICWAGSAKMDTKQVNVPIEPKQVTIQYQDGAATRITRDQDGNILSRERLPGLDLKPGPFEEGDGKLVQVREPAVSPWHPAPLGIWPDEDTLNRIFKRNPPVPPKPSRIRRIASYIFSPAKTLAQHAAFLAVVSGIGYGGWKTCEWMMENMPTIKWESTK